MPKPYTASTAPIVDGPLPGMTAWVECATKYSGGALWNNGTYVKRDIRGKPGQVSNHAKGIAADLSYRYMPASQRGVPNGRIKSLEFIKTCLRNYDELGLMLVIDYWPKNLAGHGIAAGRLTANLPAPGVEPCGLRFRVRPGAIGGTLR
jgi:hypothetical protein